MKEELEEVHCPKCGSDDSFIVFRGRDYLYHVEGEYFVSECRSCGFYFQNPCPVADEIPNLYPKTYLPHAKPISNIKPLSSEKKNYLRRHLGYNHFAKEKTDGFNWRPLSIFNSLRKWSIGVELTPYYIAGGKLLEIGCASGGRLIQLQKLGWQYLYGIELVPEAAECTRAEGFLVECGEVEDILPQYPDNFFDVIISSMVLEHLYSPFKVVCTVASKLKQGGQFLFSTINRDSLDAKIYGKYWAGFDFPRHLVHFRKQDIKDMLNNWFDNIEFFYQVAPIDFIRSSKWRSENESGRIKMIDKIILRINEDRLKYIVMILAWLGLTCRVSCRCKKK